MQVYDDFIIERPKILLLPKKVREKRSIDYVVWSPVVKEWYAEEA